MGDAWDNLVASFEATVGSCNVTRRALSLGSRDSVTGWRAKSYTESTIKMIVIPRSTTGQAMQAGTYVRLDAVGLTDTACEESDQISVGSTYYEVEAIRDYCITPDTVEYYQCDLIKLPLIEETFTFTAEASSYYDVENTGATYTTVRNAASGNGKTSAIQIENAWISTSSIYSISRSCLAFNTATLPDNLTIKSVRLYMKRWYDAYYLATHKVKVQKWTDGPDGVDLDDYSKFDGVNYDDDKALLSNWSAHDVLSYVEITNFSVISKTGFTYIILRFSGDVDAEVPTEDYWMNFNSTTSKPYLVIKGVT